MATNVEINVPNGSGSFDTCYPQTSIDAIKELARKKSTAYNVNDMAYHSDLPAGWHLKCTTAGTTSSGVLTISNTSDGASVSDGTVVWKVEMGSWRPRILSANTTIYVSKNGTGDGSSASQAMSMINLKSYLATTVTSSAGDSLNSRFKLTILFVPVGSSYGNMTFCSGKMPGIDLLEIGTSTGVNTTLENWETNAPLFDTMVFQGSMDVTLKNVQLNGSLNARNNALIQTQTYLGLTRFSAVHNGIIEVYDGIYNIHNSGADCLVASDQDGIFRIASNNVQFNFRNQCYYTSSIFYCYYSWLDLRYNYMKLTGIKPVVVISQSGTLTGTSSTASSTVEKKVTLESGQTFTLTNGAVAYIQFTNRNTADNPTLNINNTGAKAIYYNNAAIPANYLRESTVYRFTYDGTKFICNNTFNRVENLSGRSYVNFNGSYDTTYNNGEWNFNGFFNSINGQTSYNSQIHGNRIHVNDSLFAYFNASTLNLKKTNDNTWNYSWIMQELDVNGIRTLESVRCHLPSTNGNLFRISMHDKDDVWCGIQLISNSEGKYYLEPVDSNNNSRYFVSSDNTQNFFITAKWIREATGNTTLNAASADKIKNKTIAVVSSFNESTGTLALVSG